MYAYSNNNIYHRGAFYLYCTVVNASQYLAVVNNLWKRTQAFASKCMPIEFNFNKKF